MDQGYSIDALIYCPATDTWSLVDGFDHDRMMWLIETAEDTPELAAQALPIDYQEPTTREAATGALPLARLKDPAGRIRATGTLSADRPLILRAEAGDAIRIDSFEIDGSLALYVASARLTPKERYRAHHQSPARRHLTAPQGSFDQGFLASGTMIATKEGPQPVDWLREGDMVLTRDNGYQPVVHIAQTTCGPDRDAELVTLEADAFGPNQPSHDLTLTPAAQILLAAPLLDLWFGETEMLARIEDFARDATPFPPLANTVLWSIVLPRPEIILAEDIWLASALVAPEFLALLEPEAAASLAPVLHHHVRAARACLAEWETAMFVRQTRKSARAAA
ncbi:Hint domain-containing protein [Albirhodobacter sp. R86504]|uniref:Hint domain-containing protein n=1 Tax=Albirhodobacter sp. R86504 TaxID=3093848 RepID=UPI00366B4AAF